MKNFLFALRYLRKLRGGTVARVISLSLGLAVGLLIFSYANYNLTSDRCFRDGDRIYQLWVHYNAPQMTGYSSSLQAPIAPALAEEIPQIEAATRLWGTTSDDVVRGDNSFPMQYILADTMFFDVLGFDVLQGDPHRALAQENQVMISESAARTIFGKKDPVGELLLLKGTDSLTVSGVFRDPDPNQHLGKFNMLRSFEYARRTMNTSWRGGDSFASYVKLREGVQIGQVEAQAETFIDRHELRGMMEEWGMKWYFFPITESSRVDSSVELISWVLMALAALTLFVAAMNYVLISISTLVSRSKTIAMLKVGGARRSDIFRIFCSETAVLTLASVVVAAFLLWALQDQVREITGTPMSELFALKCIWVPLIVILAAFALAALVPARIFTSIPVTLAFRGATDNRRRWKQVLLVVEIVSCTFTLTLLLLAVLQFDKLRNGDFGFVHDRIVYTRLKTPLPGMAPICDAVAALPEVEAAGASEDLPIWGYSGQPCYDEKSKELLFSCRYTLCNEAYMPAMGMQIAAGRNFVPQSNPFEVIVNETYVRLRGWTPREAVGRQIIDEDSADARLYTIVGVVKDFRTVIATGQVDPIVMHPLNYYTSFPRYTPEIKLRWYLMIRLREMSPEALAAVQRKIEEYPSDNNHVLTVYDDLLGDTLSEIRSFRNIVFTVSGITLLIALMGLVGYLGDEMRRRSKEIALRKVNGASTADVLRLLSRDVLWIAVPSVIVGAAISRWGADLLVSNFVERVALRWWLFALCGSVVLLIVCAVQLVRTWRIANANPIDMIKTE